MSRHPPSIVLVVSHPPAETAGAGTVATFLHLVDQGWHAHLVFDGATARRGPDVPELSALPLRDRVHLSRTHRPRGTKRLAMPLGVIRGLGRYPTGLARYMRAGGRPHLSLLRGQGLAAALIALRPQLVHFDSVATASTGLRVKRLWPHRAVVSLTPEELHSDRSSRHRAVWEEADLLECPDDRTWQEAVRAGCSPRKPRALIPLPFDTAFFDPGPPGPADAGQHATRSLRLFSVGPLSWKQGYEWALQAVRRLLNAGVRCEYRIAGHGEYADAVYFARYELDIERCVSFLPPPSREELRAHLRWADVYVDSAVAAGARGATREALTMGVPVVATDRTGLPDGAAQGETLFVLPRRDAAVLAERLAELAGNSILRREMGRAARQSALGRLGLDGFLAERERLYRGLLGD